MPLIEEDPPITRPRGTTSRRPPRWGSGSVLRPQRSEEHTSELQSLRRISYAVFCLKKNNKQQLAEQRALHEINNKYLLFSYPPFVALPYAALAAFPYFFFFLIKRLPLISTRTDTPFPYTTLFR